MSTEVFNGHLVPPRILDFSDLTPIEVPVKLLFNGTPTDFILREASHAVVRHYRSQSMKGAELTFGDDDTKTIKNLSGSAAMDTWLLAQCLFRLDPATPGVRYPVKEDFISALPDRVTSAIMEELQEISPSLRIKEDLPSLRKQLTKLQEKIARLEEQEERSSPKKLQSSGTES